VLHIFICVVEKKIHIFKKWRKTIIYTLWMFDYYIKRNGNVLLIDDIDAMIMVGLKNTFITCQSKICLTQDQLKFLMVMIDHVNIKLLDDLAPPFTKQELEYFKLSQQFMERYNKEEDIYKAWEDTREELVELIK